MVSEDALRISLKNLEVGLQEFKAETKQSFADLRAEIRPIVETRALDRQTLMSNEARVSVLEQKVAELHHRSLLFETVNKAHEARMETHEHQCRRNEDRIQKLEIWQSRAMAFFAGMQFVTLVLFSLIVVYGERIADIIGAK